MWSLFVCRHVICGLSMAMGFGTVRAICCCAGVQELEASRVAGSCRLDATFRSFVMVS